MVTMSEGPTTEVSLFMAAPPSEVWDLITDPGLIPEFSGELESAGWGSHTGDVPGIGSTIWGHSRHELAGEWDTVSFVTEWDPPNRFAWAVSDPETPAASWWFAIEEVPGGVRLTEGVRLGPGRSKLSEFIAAAPEREAEIIEGRLAQHRVNMIRTLEGFRSRTRG